VKLGLRPTSEKFQKRHCRIPLLSGTDEVGYPAGSSPRDELTLYGVTSDRLPARLHIQTEEQAPELLAKIWPDGFSEPRRNATMSGHPALERPMTPEDPPRTPEEAEELRKKAELKAFIEDYDRRLKACFDDPDFGRKVDAMMDAQGHTKKRPIAGESY
jgi:hypothetical protein